MTFSVANLSLILAWWSSFGETDQRLFESFFGGIMALTSVVVATDFVEALRPYWLSHLSLFRFGATEMAPTLEEYQFMMGMEPNLDCLAVSIRDKSARSYFSQMSGVRKQWIDVVVVDGFPTLSVSQMISLFDLLPAIVFNKKCRFLSPSGGDTMSRRRVLSLGFILLAGLCFPRSDGLLDLRVSFYVVGILEGKTAIPAILTETARAMTTVCLNSGRHFHGCVELLYIWLVGHVFHRSGLHPSWFRESVLAYLVRHYSQASRIPRDLLSWREVFGCISPESVTWNAGMPEHTVLSVAGSRLDFLPLVGLDGVVPYFGRRLLRQAGYTQNIPLAQGVIPYERFYFDFFLLRFQPLVHESEQQWPCREMYEMQGPLVLPRSTLAYDEWMQQQLEIVIACEAAPTLVP